MLPDLVSLALFLRAVETGSLSKAAEQSHIALAAASRRIALMEDRYGVKLLYRSSQGVEVTPAGEALAHHAHLLLNQAEKLEGDLSDYAKGVRGHVRIQTNTSAMIQFLPGDLALFAKAYPDVKIELEENRSREIVNALHDGKTDIGVIVEGVPTDGLACFTYRHDRLVAVLPVEHPLRAAEVNFSELLEYDFIGLDGSTVITQLMSRAASERGERLKLRVQVRSFEAVSKLVQAGMGIGLLPEAAAQDVAEVMGLRLVHLRDDWTKRTMYVCVRDPASLPLIGRKLLQMLVGDQELRRADHGVVE